MWKITKHKAQNNQQELQLTTKVKDLEHAFASDSEGLIYDFKNRLKEIKRTNCFSAENAYKMIPLNNKSVEIWKLKVDGDFNYKMFTLDYAGENPNPFNF